MTHMKALLAGVIVLAGSFGAANMADAVEATPIEKAELAQLSPRLRHAVEGRLSHGDTVHGVVETMLLNNVSQDFASQRIVATDFQRGDVVVEGKNGQMRVFPFDTETLVIRP